MSVHSRNLLYVINCIWGVEFIVKFILLTNTNNCKIHFILSNILTKYLCIYYVDIHPFQMYVRVNCSYLDGIYNLLNYLWDMVCTYVHIYYAQFNIIESFLILFPGSSRTPAGTLSSCPRPPPPPHPPTTPPPATSHSTNWVSKYSTMDKVLYWGWHIRQMSLKAYLFIVRMLSFL